MARPKKNNADYFSHDAGMRNHGKIKALRKKFGFEGYSVWCMLLELLTSKDGFKCKWNELNIEITAGDFDIDSIRLVEIVEYLKLLELVAVENGFLFSPNHIERFSGLIAKRTRDNTRYEQQKESETPKKIVSVSENPPKTKISVSENPQSKVKEIKENNITVIFDFWNSQGIIKHKELKEPISRAIGKTLKNFSIEDIKTAIFRYAEANKSGFKPCEYKWTLKEFLSREKGISEFFDDGSKWINFSNWQNNNIKPKNGSLQTTTKNNSKPKVKQYEMGVR